MSGSPCSRASSNTPPRPSPESDAARALATCPPRRSLRRIRHAVRPRGALAPRRPPRARRPARRFWTTCWSRAGARRPRAARRWPPRRRSGRGRCCRGRARGRKAARSSRPPSRRPGSIRRGRCGCTTRWEPPCAFAGRGAEATGHHEVAMAIAVALADPIGCGISRLALGSLAQDAGRTAEARAEIVEAAALFRAAGDRRRLGWALHHLAIVESALGNAPLGRSDLRRSARPAPRGGRPVERGRRAREPRPARQPPAAARPESRPPRGLGGHRAGDRRSPGRGPGARQPRVRPRQGGAGSTPPAPRSSAPSP